MSASATVPEGYKQTEIGVFPKDWEVVNVDSILHGKSTKETGFDYTNSLSHSLIGFMDRWINPLHTSSRLVDHWKNGQEY